MAARPRPESVGLPPRPFLYTLDQIAGIIATDTTVVRQRYVHFAERSIGPFRPRERMMARNLALPNEKPDWRVAESELVRWMTAKGFRFHERGWLTD